MTVEFNKYIHLQTVNRLVYADVGGDVGDAVK